MEPSGASASGWHRCPRCGAAGASRAHRQLAEYWLSFSSNKRPYRCRVCEHRFLDDRVHPPRSHAGRRQRGDGSARSTEDLVLLMLRTRLAVWMVAALTMGVAVAVGGRASIPMALIVAVPMLAAGTIVITAWDAIGSKTPQSWRRPHETRTAKVTALAVALVTASVITGLVLGLVTTLLSAFEKRPESSRAPSVIRNVEARNPPCPACGGPARGAC